MSFLKTIHKHKDILENSSATLCFDFNDIIRIVPLLKGNLLKNFRFIFLSPYVREGSPLTNVKVVQELESYFGNWLHVPPLDVFTVIRYKNYRPCLYSVMAIDSNLNIANCKGYWINDQVTKLSRNSLKEIISKWQEDENDLCFQCALRLGCFSCKIFMDHLSKKLGFCFIRDSLFKVKSTL